MEERWMRGEKRGKQDTKEREEEKERK
jgi:hypothetical protein